MSASPPLPDRMAEAERRIAWALAHSAVSPWLKDALRAAVACDPIVASNDVEMLRELLRARTDAVVDRWLHAPGDPVRTIERIGESNPFERPRAGHPVT